jgi:predicted metal-dependent phosphoesterase TrpH
MIKLNKFLGFIFLLFISQLAKAQDTLLITKNGRIKKSELYKLVYVPIEIPEGINMISLKEIYKPEDGGEKNVLNLGIYDPRGDKVGVPKGFRGWSGGAKTSFFINNQTASTGYIPGMIYPGLWHVLIYASDISETGIDWELEIKAVRGRETPPSIFHPAQNSINEIAGWYHGDLHMHTLHSDGQRTAQELVDEAHLKNLDFIVSTEHNTTSANLNWGKYDSKNLLIINGEEVTSTQFGHWNAIGLSADNYIDWRYDPDEGWINKIIYQVHQDNGLAIINHPFYNKQMTFGFKYDTSLFDGVEVWNGSWNLLDNLAVNWWNKQLMAGHKLIAIGASDTHVSKGSTNNLGLPETVVFAQGLSKNKLIKGIKEGKVYIRANDNIEIDFKISKGSITAMLGETLKLKNNQHSFDIHLQIKNCNQQKMILFSNLGVLKQEVLASNNENLKFKINNPNIKFLRLEIRGDEDKMLALTNPIFIARKSSVNEN